MPTRSSAGHAARGADQLLAFSGMGIGISPGGSRSGFMHRRWRDLATNIALLGVLWLAYTTARTLTADDILNARQNATELMRLQASVGLPSEALLQSRVLHLPGLLRAANTHYVALHFPATIFFLAWVWLRHRSAFGRIRNTLVAATGMGLLLHVTFPLAPPRMFAGFVDTARWLGPDPYELSISAAANQIAAMPSMHVGWAMIVAVGVSWILHSPFRWLSMLHPAVTCAVVLVTANHYWTDAIVALLIVAAAWMFALHIEGGVNQIRQVAGNLTRGSRLLTTFPRVVDHPPDDGAHSPAANWAGGQHPMAPSEL